MKKIVFFTIGLLLIIACSDVSGTNSQNEEQRNIVGWRSAGFFPEISSERGGGLQKVVHSGNWLVIMDAWTSPVEGKPGTLTYSPRLFVSKIGSDVWDTLIPPTTAYIIAASLYADSSYIYVGTYKTGQIFMYNPENKEWSEIEFMKKKE